MPVIKWGISPGIRRDGPLLDDQGCLGGNWIRFNQRGNPIPMGGYQHLAQDDSLIAEDVADAVLVNLNIQQETIFDNIIPVTKINTIPSVPYLHDGSIQDLPYPQTFLRKGTKLYAKFQSSLGTSYLKLDFYDDSGTSESLIFNNLGESGATTYSYKDSGGFTARLGILTTFAKALITYYDTDILESLSSVSLTYASLISVSADKPAPRDLSIILTGSKFNDDGTLSPSFSETIIMKSGESYSISKNSFKILNSVVVLGIFPPDVKFSIDQKNIILLNQPLKLKVPSSVFFLAKDMFNIGIPSISLQMKAVNYMKDIVEFYDIISNDSLSPNQAVFSQGIYFFEIQKIILVNYPPNKVMRLTLGTRDYVLLKDFSLSYPSNLKITSNPQVLEEKKLFFSGYDENNSNVEEEVNLTGNNLTSKKYSTVNNAIISGFVISQTIFNIRIETPFVYVLKNVFVTPSDRLVFKNKTNAQITFTISQLSRNQNGTPLQGPVVVNVPANSSASSGIFLSYIDNISIDSSASFSIYTAQNLSHGSFRCIPRNCLLTPDLENDDTWLLIVGFTAEDLNSSINKMTYGDLVQMVRVDSKKGRIQKLPQSILSNSITQKYDNPQDVHWSFDTFSTNHTVMLLACQLNSLHNIAGNNKPCPVLIDDVNQSSSIKLSPISSKYGLSKTATGDEDCIYSSGGILSIYPYVFILNYAAWSPIEKKPINVTGSIAYTTVEMKPDESGSIIKQIQPVASTNIIHGESIRGGGAPAGLFWSLNSLIRATFQQNTSNPFSFDVVSQSISVLSSQSIVEYNGLFFWIGVDCFYVFNGNVSVVQNTFNKDFFFQNLDIQERQKVWGTLVNGDEIMWHYPNKNLPGYLGECNAYLLYNVVSQIWSDGYFPITSFDQSDFNPLGENPILEKKSKGRSCGIRELQGFGSSITFENTPSENIFVEDQSDSAYRAFFSDKGYDYVFPCNLLHNETHKMVDKIAPIYSYLRSNLMSCFLGKNNIEEFVGTEIADVSFNIVGKGNLKLDFFTSSYINEKPFQNAGRRLADIANTQNLDRYPSYDVFLEDETSICPPQNLSGNAQTTLQMTSTPIIFPCDGRVSISWKEHDIWSGTYALLKGRYGKELQIIEERVDFDNGFFFKNLVRQIDSLDIGNANMKTNFVSVGFSPPTPQDLIDQSDESLENRGNNLASLIDQKLFWVQEVRETGNYISFAIKKYNINGYYELGPSLFTIYSASVSQ